MTGDEVFFIFGVLMFILIIMLIVCEHKNLKVFALITPAIISIILFGALFIKRTGVVSFDQNEYVILTEYIDNKIDIGLSIIGIAVSVWIGLNIYNVIENREIEKLKELLEMIELQSETLQQKIELNMNKLESETEERLSYVKIETNYLNTKNTTLLAEKQRLYIETIELIEKYPKSKDNEFKAKIYLEYVGLIAPIIDIIKQENTAFEMLEKALELTCNPMLESNIHSEYARLAYNVKDLDLAYYHANAAYMENEYDYEKLGFLIDVLDNQNTPVAFMEIAHLIKKFMYILPDAKDDFKETLKKYDIQNIYNSDYKDEIIEILEY